ncbi:MAG: hypothetical protein QOE33_70 [Acidobacteriota bacterium]|nr:hypothetical protein [Acidobacteriota bacterium]
MELLRDPLWQFIGVILALIAIAISFFIHYLQRQRKSLAYEITANTPVLTVNEQIEGKIEVLYENIPVNNVRLVTVKVINNGNVPITSNDYERKLSFILKGEVKILSSEILETYPESLETPISVDENKITIEPILMNRKDYIVLKALVSNFEGKIDADARIIGVNKVIDITNSFAKRRIPFFFGLISGMLTGTILFYLSTKNIVFLITSIIGILMTISPFIWSRFSRRR